MRWVNARKLKLTANFQVKERYRSGHNGADSKSDGRVIPARGFESHPLRHLIFEAFLRLESLGSFPTAKLLPNSGDFRGRITICVTQFDTVFTAEIAAREAKNAARAAGLFSIAFLIA